MSNPTPTPPQNPVPSEPGFYFATYKFKHHYESERGVVQIYRNAGELYAVARGIHFETHRRLAELEGFSDFSPRITEPHPPAAPVAGDALAEIREALAASNYGHRSRAILGGICQRKLAALLDELEQLRGIIHRFSEFPSGDGTRIELDYAWLRSPEGKAAVEAAKGGAK